MRKFKHKQTGIVGTLQKDQHVHLDQQIWSLSMRKANGNHVWKIDVSDFLKIKNWYFQP